MKYILLILIIASVALYLNRTYAHIYNFISAEHNIKNQNSKVVYHMSATKSKPARAVIYVALGDSLTAGVGAESANLTYPYTIASRLSGEKQAQVNLINLGIPGATSADVVNQQLPQVANLRPDLVTLLIGVNDIHNRVPIKTFQQNISKIVSGLIAANIQNINIITIPFIGNGALFYSPWGAYFNWQTNRYNAALKAALAERPVNIIDLNSIIKTQGSNFTEGDYYSADNFHPSGPAYTRWGYLLYGTLHY